MIDVRITLFMQETPGFVFLQLGHCMGEQS